MLGMEGWRLQQGRSAGFQPNPTRALRLSTGKFPQASAHIASFRRLVVACRMAGEKSECRGRSLCQVSIIQKSGPSAGLVMDDKLRPTHELCLKEANIGCRLQGASIA